MKVKKLTRANWYPKTYIDEDKGKGGWAKGCVDETRDRTKPLHAKKKGYEGRNRPIPVNKKVTRLTGHIAGMHLNI